MQKFRYTPILGWSASRYDTFVRCKRLYFYTYYAKFDLDFPTHQIKALKSLTTIPLEIGNIAHDMIKSLLERLQISDEPVDREKFLRYVRRKTLDYCQKPFQEVYYSELDKIDVENMVYLPVVAALEAFMNSRRFEWIQSQPMQNRTRWIIEPPGFGETRIEGLKAYCKVDFLFPENEHYVVLDWKTGKEDRYRHHAQLLGYVYWASFHLRAPSDEIVPIVAYLAPAYKEVQLEMQPDEIKGFAAKVRKQTADMYEYCSTIKANVPLEKNVFPLTHIVSYCHYCNFRELCGR